MLTRSLIGKALLLLVVILLVVPGCASPEEIAKRQAQAFIQTQEASIKQTAEAIRLTAEAAIKDAIPDLPNPPIGEGQPEAIPSFERIPIESPRWWNGFGAIIFAQNNWKANYTNTGGLHNGLDFGTKVDATTTTTVYAGLYGVLTGTSGDAQKPGNVVVTVGDYIITYGHTIRDPNLVEGQQIKPDTVIGLSGDQGNNDHLHLSVKANGRYYNPLYFFKEGLIDSSKLGPYVEKEDPYSIVSYIPQPVSKGNYWENKEDPDLDIKRP